MSDLISRQLAIDACHNYEEGKDAYAFGYVVEERLQNLPSAQPEIIRCKDCTRYEKKRGCNLVEGLNIATENCFCSYAERREE